MERSNEKGTIKINKLIFGRLAYDAEAGNPGIKGTLQIVSENELQLNCNTEDDFDPPVTWGDMEETQKLTYEFVTDKELRASFVYEDGKSTLVFTKME